MFDDTGGYQLHHKKTSWIQTASNIHLFGFPVDVPIIFPAPAASERPFRLVFRSTNQRPSRKPRWPHWNRTPPKAKVKPEQNMSFTYQETRKSMNLDGFRPKHHIESNGWLEISISYVYIYIYMYICSIASQYDNMNVTVSPIYPYSIPTRSQ